MSSSRRIAFPVIDDVALGDVTIGLSELNVGLRVEHCTLAPVFVETTSNKQALLSPGNSPCTSRVYPVDSDRKWGRLRAKQLTPGSLQPLAIFFQFLLNNCWFLCVLLHEIIYRAFHFHSSFYTQRLIYYH